jgi:hypothetical protein
VGATVLVECMYESHDGEGEWERFQWRCECAYDYAIDHEWAQQVGYRLVFLVVNVFAGRGVVEAGFSRAKRVKLLAFLFGGERSFELQEVCGLKPVCVYGLHDCCVQCWEND